MKLRNGIAIGCLSILLGIGAFAGVASNQKPVEKVEATPGPTEALYLDVSNSWNADSNNKWFGAWTWGNGVSAMFIGFNSTTHSDLFYANLSNSYTNFSFYRFNSETNRNYFINNNQCPSDDNQDVWNKIKDQYRSSTSYNKFSTTSYTTGSWGSYSPVTNGTVYFVDGYSFHNQGDGGPFVHLWGGTADTSFYSQTMVDTKFRLKCKVGDAWQNTIYIYKYTFTGTATSVLFVGKDNGTQRQTGNQDVVDGGIYYFGVDEKYRPVIQLMIDLSSHMAGNYVFNNMTFTGGSICNLTSSQASAFVSSYDALKNGDNIKDSDKAELNASVQGSSIVTYNSPKTSNVSTGNVTLANIRTALIEKYPEINPESPSGMIRILGNSNSDSTTLITVVITVLSITVFAAFLLLKKKKEF